MESKRKIEESFALLNSLWAHPPKRLHQHPGEPQAPLHETSTLPQPDRRGNNNNGGRSFIPPRPPILDKLAKLSSKPTLSDSIAASIAASAPARHLAQEQTTGDSNKTEMSSQKSTLPTLTKSHGTRTPKFLPWSREQFHSRLETFRPSTWFDKPKLVNAVECAKRGWINKGEDRLECCGGCSGVVIVKTEYGHDKSSESPSMDTDSAEQEVTTEASFTDEIDLDDDSDQDDEVLGRKFHGMLSSNHSATCPWRSHPCDDSIYRLPTMSVSRARAEILERVSRLGAIVDNHSLDSIRHPLSQSQVGSLEQMFDDALDKRLLILSLFGWDAAKGQSLLACEACHTQCALIPHVDRADSDLQGSSKEPDSFSDIEEETGFNVEEAHKWYCYWVNPEYDAESVSDHKRAGWRILFELLLSSSIVERGVLHSQQPPEVPHSQPSEQLARIRQMLRPASRTVS